MVRTSGSDTQFHKTWLFCQAIIVHLVKYQGNSIHKNSEFPPSVVIAGFIPAIHAENDKA